MASVKTTQWKPPMFEKQEQVFLCATKYLLLSGPRLAGKTIAGLHRMMVHAYMTKPRPGCAGGARLAMLAISQASAADEGTWSTLVHVVIPMWIDAGLVKWVKEPYQDGITKKHKCEITNAWGGTATFLLESLANEKDVEIKMKNKAYSFVFIVEASNFRTKLVFQIVKAALRAPHIDPKDYQIILDTNPAEDGKRSWIYDLFFVYPTKEVDDDDERVFQSMLGVIKFTIDDNIFANKTQIAELKASYKSNQNLYDRYILGEWVEASGDGVFSDVLLPAIHFIGGTRPEDEEMMLEDNCTELITGWDIGKVNHSAHILEPFRVMVNGQFRFGFKVIDELVYLKGIVGTREFTVQFVKKMRYWEEQAGRKLRWQHWSDDSAFEVHSNDRDDYDYLMIMEASGGEIQVQAVSKGPDSVYQRVRLVRDLLFYERLFVDAERCPATMDMLLGLRRAASSTRGGMINVDRDSPHKHAFDSMSYPLRMACYDEVAEAVMRPKTAAPSMVSVSL